MSFETVSELWNLTACAYYVAYTFFEAQNSGRNMRQIFPLCNTLQNHAKATFRSSFDKLLLILFQKKINLKQL